ncbi:MAG: hypothetical protein KGZ97_08950 [Bacteroidetes bacterium]|nr:hypothetical protein [Bacteroidota bacterium]
MKSMGKLLLIGLAIMLMASFSLKSQSVIKISQSTISLISAGNLTALHFEVTTKDVDKITAKMLIPGYQLVCNPKETKLSCIVYSMELTPFPAGDTEIIKLEGISDDNEFIWEKAEASDVNHKTVFLETVVE